MVYNNLLINYYDNDLNEMFHYIKKIINNNLTKYEKNLLYKDFINNIILGKYKY